MSIGEHNFNTWKVTVVKDENIKYYNYKYIMLMFVVLEIKLI